MEKDTPPGSFFLFPIWPPIGNTFVGEILFRKMLQFALPRDSGGWEHFLVSLAQ